MKPSRLPSSVAVAVLGAGLIGRHLAALLAKLSAVRHVRVVDRDMYEAAQWPAHADRPKAEVLAEVMRGFNPSLEVEAVAADIESLPLGRFRCDVLLTCLDSKRARIRANFAFQRLAIPYWIDAGVSSPSLVRVSGFPRGARVPCYECGLAEADYAAEQSYPCQSAFVPPPTRSPEYLGALAASFQAAALAKLLDGDFDRALVSQELLFDVASHRAVVTRLVHRADCRAAHRALAIRSLRLRPSQLTVAQALALGSPAKDRQPTASLRVPGMVFVRELVCACGVSRPVFCLKGRIPRARQTCPACRSAMFPLGFSLTDRLDFEALSPGERNQPLSALAFLPADVIALQRGPRTEYFELSN